ncbi:DNA polymerase III subunit delta' [Lacimicrobium alkaliphilum]|uniref:DNA-directed DNA polymerase n=1 Tax=Lacimicrobium alkaliphilum TaxID=1526571 RepID=A0ABQ1RSU7_9ALTE|nr:DNA polymerase III subunit delta' [Lacimicrobium alkaliphilum]GGD78316.1 DNA polymerase III subunit delta' [Lacimicrobium alkaliphilum]
MIYPWFESVFEQLGERIRSSHLHHGLLLLGPQGLGKAELAQELAGYLLCQHPQTQRCGQCQSCSLFNAASHPDFYQIQSDKQIGVDDIRQAGAKLSGMAQLSGAKVLIIYQAHTMTESASNALLKTLEEPGQGTYLLLTSNKPERLLATILSRCEKIRLPKPDSQQTHRWLEQQQLQAEPELLAMYSDSPLQLKALLEDSDGPDYASFKLQLSEVIGGKKSALELASEWQEQADRLLGWLQFDLLQRLKQQPRDDKLWGLCTQCSQARAQVTKPGLNKALLLNSVLQSLTELRN